MKPIVFKLGGEALTNPPALVAFLNQVKAIAAVKPVVIVHGGGPQVEEMMQVCQLQTEKINGLRATPDQQLPVVIGALAGVASQQLLAACKRVELNALALSLADADMFIAEPSAPELGNVGTVKANNSASMQRLLEAGFLVLLNSIGCSEQGQSLNVNADDAAVAVAQLLGADLCLLSNVPGVLDQDSTLIPSLNGDSIESLIRQGVIRDGMAVKVKAALDAAAFLRRPVHIGSWQDSNALSELSHSATVAIGSKITHI